MAQPNFKFQKRQKELDRIKKQQEKALRKQEKSDPPLAEEADLQAGQTDEIGA